MTSEELRRSLLASASQNRSYEFLNAALPYLEQSPDDDQVRLQGIRHFAQLGLFGPAAELIDDRPELLAQAPDLKGPLATLRQQPTGCIQWESLAETFERNLTAACERFDACRQQEQRIRESLRPLELYRCKDGNFLLSRRVDRAPRRWLPSIMDWIRTVAETRLCPSDSNSVCLPYMIEGVGFGHALRKIYDGTSKMFLTYKPLVHLLELNVAQFAVWLNLDDHCDILRDERFHVWLGQQGEEQFMEFNRAHPQQAPPDAVIRQPGWDVAAKSVASRAIERLAKEAEARATQIGQAIQAKLAYRDGPAYYAEKFRRRVAEPLRIFGITSRYTTFLQYSMRDIKDAATEMGHTFRTLVEDTDHMPAFPRHYVLQQIKEFMPHLIIIIDHNRKELSDLYDFRIPWCNWIQDDLTNLFGPGCGSNLHPYDIVVGMIGHLRARASGYPHGQWHSLPMPVSLKMFSHEPVSEADRRNCACDISFVTNLSITAEAFLRDTLAKADQPEVRRLVQAQYEQLGPQIAAGQVPGSPQQIISRTQQLAHELGFELSYADADHIRRIFTDRLINIYFRQQVLQWASDMALDLHIYGRGWEKHPTLAKHARGIADHGHHLRCIYQSSKINIQAIPSGAVHQRLMEGLCSGGFFVIRRTPFDTHGDLVESIMHRCVAMNIQTEDELWNTSDETLARDVRTLNDALYSPHRLYDGFVGDMHVGFESGFRAQVHTLKPHYDEVGFGTREEFEGLMGRFLNDPAARREIADTQRKIVAEHFSYDAIFERVLAFAERYFTNLAAKETCLVGSE